MMGPGKEQTPLYIQTQVQLAFCCGVVFAIMMVLRLSWVSNMLSAPVLNGFVMGSAGIILGSQLKDLFGINSPGNPSDFRTRVSLAFTYIGTANPVSAGMGAASLALLLWGKDVSIRGYRLPKLFPLPLLVLLVGILLSWGLDLSGRYRVGIVGSIPSSLPTFSFPFSGPTAAADFAAVFPNSILLAVVGLVQTLGVGYAFAKKSKAVLSPFRELAGSTAAHLVGCCFSSLTISGSVTRSAIAYEAGALTAATGVFTGCLMMLAITFLTPYLRYLPKCVLAAIVVSACKTLLDTTEMRDFWRGKKTDFLQQVVTVVAILVLEVQNGLFTGIGVSFLLVLHRAFQPRIAETARLPGTQCFVAVERFPEAIQVPGILVLRVDGELCFGNIHSVEARLLAALSEVRQWPPHHSPRSTSEGSPAAAAAAAAGAAGAAGTAGAAGAACSLTAAGDSPPHLALPEASAGGSTPPHAPPAASHPPQRVRSLYAMNLPSLDHEVDPTLLHPQAEGAEGRGGGA